MATRESIARRQDAATGRIATAVETLAVALGQAVTPAPALGRSIAPDYRAMIEREVLADNLERLATGSGGQAGQPGEPDQELDARRAEAAAALEAAGVTAADINAGAVDGAISLADAAGVAIATAAQAMATALAQFGLVAPDSVTVGGETYVIAQLDDLTRDQLNQLATAAGVAEPEKLKSKPVVIAAIVEAATSSDEGSDVELGEGDTP